MTQLLLKMRDFCNHRLRASSLAGCANVNSESWDE